jgi:phosphatidate cytidylyltransferase
MAFNLQTFKTRTLTAIVFAMVMLVGLLWNGTTFFYLFVIIHFGCWYEFIKLLKKINKKIFGYFIPFGLLYITLPFLLMIDVGFPNTNHWVAQKGYEDAFDYSPILPCGIIFSIWINDTMAYIVGSFIGRTQFSKISPKKTWEGTAGGAILCIAVIALISWWLNFNVKHFTIIAAICAIFGTLGDLLESKLKRMAQVKDSGSLMPGHGGFLDRFDSLLIATPFVWLYVYFFMR